MLTKPCRSYLRTAVIAALPLVASTANAALSGRVLLPNANPVAGVTLKLQSSGVTAITNSLGQFRFEDATTLNSRSNFSKDPIISARGSSISILLTAPAMVRVRIFDMNGRQVGLPVERSMSAGEFDASPFHSLPQAGLYLVRVSAGTTEAAFRISWSGSSEGSAIRSLPSVNNPGLRLANGAVDGLTIRYPSDSIGEVSLWSATGTVPDITILQRTFTGRLTGNTAGMNSILIKAISNAGDTLELDPDWNATSGTYFATEGWSIAGSSVTWNATATVGGNSGTLGTNTKWYSGTTTAVTFDNIALSQAQSSSSLTPSSSSRPSSSSVVASSSSGIGKPNPPAALQASIDWVWENRIKDPTEANALGFYNYIFDQILAEKGSLYFCVRWESNTTVTRAQRDKFEPMVNRAINNWTKWLKGYDGWPYDSIPVHIVGWALTANDKLDQTGMTVPVYINGGLEANGAAAAPICPDACNRDRFHNTGRVNTTYPNCTSPNKHFDMTLWGTDGFNGGAGGDWGSRTGASYILSVLDAKEPHIIEHEFGHGFSLPDFYDANQFPPSGLPTAIMQAGASAVITEWDGWMLRRVWSELKAAPGRIQF